MAQDSDDDFVAELFDGGLDDSSTYVAAPAAPPPPPLTPWGAGPSNKGSKKGGHKPVVAPTPVLILPKAHLQQHCMKQGLGAPRFTKR